MRDNMNIKETSVNDQTDEIIIRKLISKDSEAVWEIFQAVVRAGDSYAFSPTILKDEGLGYWMGSDKTAYVVESAGNILGTYVVKDNQPELGAHIANASFMVSPEARGKSIGRKMGEHALAEAKSMGYYAMQFNFVVSTNTAAIKLWEKFGFTIIGVIPDAFQHQVLNKYVDAYIMYKKL